MIRLSRLADYAVVILAHMAQQDSASADRILHSAHTLAGQTHLALPTVSKILKALVKAELLLSVRGSRGGYTLAREARYINVADVIEAVDGPIGLTECAEGGGGECTLESVCSTRNAWRRINSTVRAALATITLEELAHPLPIPVALPERTLVHC